MNRRNFLKLSFATAALTTVPKTVLAALPDKENIPKLYCDKVNCDADGLQAFIDGRPFEYVGSQSILPKLERYGEYIVICHAVFYLEKTVYLGAKVTIRDCIVSARFQEGSQEPVFNLSAGAYGSVITNNLIIDANSENYAGLVKPLEFR